MYVYITIMYSIFRIVIQIGQLGTEIYTSTFLKLYILT